MLGDRTVTVHEGVARLDDGVMAGSLLTMDAAVRALVAAGATVSEAVHAATRVPAQLAHHPALGTLAPGSPAGVAFLDDTLRVTRTLLAGRETHAA